MTENLFDMFKIGTGPSSSHTVGPMIAARRFVLKLKEVHPLDAVCRLRVELYGLLALTGKGHATDRVVGAVKAINACRMAMNEAKGCKLTFDQIIEAIYRTGIDMQSRYKETSLAANVIEC